MHSLFFKKVKPPSFRTSVCELIEGKPKALEHEEIRWVQRQDIKELDWAEADVPILEAYLYPG